MLEKEENIDKQESGNKKRFIKKKPGSVPPPYLPADYELHHVQAIKAFFEGRATPAQQEILRDYILYELTKFYDISYRGENTHDSAFAEGKRYIGQQLVKLSKLKLDEVFPNRLKGS